MSQNHPDADQTPLQVVLEVADHSSFQQLMDAINGADLPVRTKAITRADLSNQTTAEIELDVLTDKQRETLALALREGYYERPRETDLSNLADRLDISKSAVSQRLRTAEIKLIKAALGQYT